MEFLIANFIALFITAFVFALSGVVLQMMMIKNMSNIRGPRHLMISFLPQAFCFLFSSLLMILGVIGTVGYFLKS